MQTPNISNGFGRLFTLVREERPLFLQLFGNTTILLISREIIILNVYIVLDFRNCCQEMDFCLAFEDLVVFEHLVRFLEQVFLSLEYITLQAYLQRHLDDI